MPPKGYGKQKKKEEPRPPWWWWVLGGVGVVGLGTLFWVMFIRVPPPPKISAEELHLRKLNALYRHYAGFHQGLGPPTEEALRQYARALTAEDRKSMQIDDVDAVFVSPRDQQRYIVHYGLALSRNNPAPRQGSGGPAAASLKDNVLAYEAVGLNGKRFVIFVNGGLLKELTDAEFQEIQSGGTRVP